MSWTNSSSPSPSLTTTTTATSGRGVPVTPAMAGSRFFPKSSATSNILSPTFPSQINSGDPVRASVAHLLVRAYTLPCSTAAQAFSQLVQPTARFQLALDALLPLLNSSVELAQRILVSFILYSMYAPYPISLNPFKSALYATFVKERGHATQVATEGGFSENEQLVWVLWKILKGDGNDIGPYSPSTLTRSPLLPELRASNLFLEEESSLDSNLTEAGISDLPQQGTTQEARILDLKGSSAGQSLTVNAELHVSPEEDEQNERIAHGMKLLLAARDRTLTLTEQRILTPLIPSLTSPPVITSMDLPPIVAHNPNIAYQLVLALLTSNPLNAQPHGPSAYIDALKQLPPTLPSFDLLVRLLQDTTILIDSSTGGKTTVADVIYTEVLGRFIHESIKWLENAEREEREGLISDDRFAKGVQNFCRFYASLIRLSVVDTTSDADTTEMIHFTLRNARFEEANTLYRILAAGRF
ncbi:hypothetical protein F5J12DRAFT_842495 [Pisolithus orientalis]|uniref:uncharacterized protein n=1 Tax=Pisolithus orientalis TaxID=936130 RepID=UPI0022245D5E|nr:uncharacterized protein F5J12DRAFT_842495 [Pisolithus orientalis]KAI6002315.1 hypothetical protein F5J12DRAFT_842495 [Pisolithus orientalis]